MSMSKAYQWFRDLFTPESKFSLISCLPSNRIPGFRDSFKKILTLAFSDELRYVQIVP
jgi:hypothetical protein